MPGYTVGNGLEASAGVDDMRHKGGVTGQADRALKHTWACAPGRRYGPQSGRPAYTIHDAHRGGVTALAAAEDGARLVSGGGDGTVRVWRVGGASRDLLASMKEHTGRVTALRLTAGGAECVSGGAQRPRSRAHLYPHVTDVAACACTLPAAH